MEKLHPIPAGILKMKKRIKKYIEDNILFHHPTLPMGEFAIGTNTTAYVAAKKYNIADKAAYSDCRKNGTPFCSR